VRDRFGVDALAAKGLKRGKKKKRKNRAERSQALCSPSSFPPPDAGVAENSIGDSIASERRGKGRESEREAAIRYLTMRVIVRSAVPVDRKREDEKNGASTATVNKRLGE